MMGWLHVMLASLAVASPAKMVYMQETPEGKHIMIADERGRDSKALTSGDLWHLYPDIDGSGTLVVYVEGKDEAHLQVILRDLKAQTVTEVTSDDASYLQPDLSNDGKMIAMSYSVKGGPSKIKVGPLMGEKKDLPTEFPAYFPALSHDGGFMVFQRSKTKDNRDIALFDFATQQTTVLSPEAGNSMSPSISNDDKYVAYTSKVNGNWDVYVIEIATRKTMRLTTEAQNDFAPTFRADNSVVFASNRSGNFALYEISNDWLKGAPVTEKLLLQQAGDLYAPSFSELGAVEQKTLPQIPAPARSSFGATKVGDKVYVIGGHQGAEHTYPAESFLTRVDIFDLKTSRWSEGASRPHGAHGYGVAAYGKYIYAFGGFAFSEEHSPKWRSLDQIDRYDTETNTWTTVGTLPRRRSSNVVAVLNDRVYLIGGWDATPKFPKDYDGTFHRQIDVFDLKSEKVETLSAQLPDPLRRALSGVVVGDEIILVGGISSGAMHFNLIDNVTAFNPKTNAWRELPKLPFATFAPAAGALDGKLWVFGGMKKVTAEEYDYINDIFYLSQQNWFSSRRTLSETKGFSQVVNLDKNTLGILGGHSYEGGNAPVATFETFRLF